MCSPSDMPSPEPPRGIHSRGYLPHWDFPKTLQAVTFRLADSVPLPLIDQWKRECQSLADEDEARRKLHQQIARYEDAGHGEALLATAACAEAMQELLLAGHRCHYLLREWVIMPNHVHVLVKPHPSVSLAAILKRWKGVSATNINRLLGRSGQVWAREYYDRWIRDEDHQYQAITYIRHNPVKAGLCATPEDWTYSSAGQRWHDRDGW